MAPASTPMPGGNAAKLVVASACATVTKLDALEHARQAVCLVGALHPNLIVSAQLVAGGKDLLLQGQATRPTFAEVAQGVSSPRQAQPVSADVAQPRGQFLVEVQLASSQAAGMVLRDAHKLAGVKGMERTFVRRALTPQLLKLKRRLIAAHADVLQEARLGADTRVRFKDDVYPCIQRRNADGQWRTESVLKDVPALATSAGAGDEGGGALSDTTA